MGQLYEKTVKKREECSILGYRYIEMWEHRWNNCKKLCRTLQKKIINKRNQSKAIRSVITVVNVSTERI